MIEQSEISNDVINISCLIDADVSRVFEAWADPGKMSQWMGPGTVTCEAVEIDLKVGGKFSLSMQTEDGIMTAFGEYQEIEINKKLVFTWQWEDGTFTNSVVNLTFTDLKGTTRLQLEHTKLPTPVIMEHHQQGWAGSVDKLADFLES